MARPKICMLFCGGTIGMVKNQETGALQPAENAGDILRKIPELQKHIQLEFKVLFNLDSSNMIPDHWTKIAETIKELYDEFDGFVVAQGTDTMSYTACALSFALQKLSKPIVFTGSLIPFSELGADARNNLIYACLTASLDIAEVCIVFSNLIFRGNRGRKVQESFTGAFHSPKYPELGELGRPIILHEWRKKRRKRVLKFQPKFEPNVSLMKLFPGFDPGIIDSSLERGTKGIVLEGFGPGNVPFMKNTIIPKIEKAISQNVPVIIVSQLERGITNLKAYEAGYRALKAGAISAKDMTTEAAITKLMWCLAQTGDQEEVKKLFSKSLAGELEEIKN